VEVTAPIDELYSKLLIRGLRSSSICVNPILLWERPFSGSQQIDLMKTTSPHLSNSQTLIIHTKNIKIKQFTLMLQNVMTNW